MWWLFTPIPLVGSKPTHSPSHHSTQACDSPDTAWPISAVALGTRYPDTYRAGMPTWRRQPTVRWAMSWHTPDRAAHASAARLSTCVDPVTYSTSSWISATTDLA